MPRLHLELKDWEGGQSVLSRVNQETVLVGVHREGKKSRKGCAGRRGSDVEVRLVRLGKNAGFYCE